MQRRGPDLGWQVRMSWQAESNEVRQLLARAREEAAAIGNDYIDTAHLLLALVSDGDAPTAELLERQGVQPSVLRERCIEKLERGEPISPDHVTELTARARASIRRADAEAARHNLKHTRAEDVLVGLCEEPDSLASNLLLDAGLTPDSLHHLVYPPDSSNPRRGQPS